MPPQAGFLTIFLRNPVSEIEIAGSGYVGPMSRFAYEMLGRATWTLGKRRVRSYMRETSHRPARWVGLTMVLLIGGIVAGELAARRG